MWIFNFLFKSSIGRKLVMSLTGLFLITFLVVHLIGNLQLLYGDDGATFNQYAYFMTNNPLIKFTSYGLYFFIILHTIQGLMIAFFNKQASASKYAVNTNENSSWASKKMALLGTIILVFLFIHMGDFWFRMKIGWISYVEYPGYDVEIANLYERVVITYSKLWIVIIYLLGLLGLAFHLNHGFASAFQTLGLNHKKYTPLINGLGKAYSILIPLGFAIIPIYIYFINR